MKMLKPQLRDRKNNALTELGLRIATASDKAEKRLNGLKDQEMEFLGLFKSSFNEFNAQIRADMDSVERLLSALEHRKSEVEKPSKEILEEAKRMMAVLKSEREKSDLAVATLEKKTRDHERTVGKLERELAEAEKKFSEHTRFMETDKRFFDTKTTTIENLLDLIDRKIESAQATSDEARDRLLVVIERLEQREKVLNIEKEEIEKIRKELKLQEFKLADREQTLKLDYDHLRKKGLL
jgi:DNA repair exonuclease SbcCD ATPase subunit